LDEADEMLNMGFAEDIEWIFEQAPSQRQVALFSATMPPAIKRVAATHLSEPVELRITSRATAVDTIEQQHCIVTRHHKLDLLTRLLELEPVEGMLVFVRTKVAAAELAEKLVAHGFAADALHGDMGQAARELAVDRLKRGRLDILVATDVAARGLDVERITHVVNFDIPNDPESYVHRIGRTGRAGRKGKALLFVQPRERHLLRAIEKAIGQGIPPQEPPSADRITEHRIQRFTELLNKTLDEQDLDFFHRLVGRIAQEQELEPLQMAAALTYLYQRKRPLQMQEPAPPRKPKRAERPGKPETGRPAKPARREAVERPEPKAKAAAGPDDPPRRPERRPRDQEPVPMVSYRIEVGQRDGVTPREIVGAIANEAGLQGRYIGRIEIAEDHSCVDLPDGMPKEIAQHLRRVVVCGRPLKLRLLAMGTRGPNRGKPGGGGAKANGKDGKQSG
jgi:ATP-dependent RNA helicase DeaD